MTTIDIKHGYPCRHPNGGVKFCFVIGDVEIGNPYYLAARCEDATGSCECCASAWSGVGGYFVDLDPVVSETVEVCILIPADGVDACTACGCCRFVFYLNQGDGFNLASVEYPLENITSIRNCGSGD